MRIHSTLLSVLVGIGAALSVQAQTLAVVGGTIIDGNGGAPVKNGVILIDGKRITAVGAAATVRIPAKARRILAEGKYIIPGLMDANVHLCGATSIESVLKYENRLPELVLEAAQLELKNGLTTVFDSWGPLPALEKVRDDIDSGRSIGSRMYVAGNIVGFSGIFGPSFDGEATEVLNSSTVKRLNDVYDQGTGPELMYMTSDQVRTRMREYLGKGMDFVKYAVNQHASAYITFSPRVQKILVEETHRAGKIIQTHQMSVEGVNLAIEAGVDMMQHCDVTGPVALPEETIQKLVAHRMPCALLSYTDERFKAASAESVGGPMDIPVMDTNVRNLIKAGANIVLSTDSYIIDPNNFFSPNISEARRKRAKSPDSPVRLGLSHFTWLKAMDEKGFPPMKNLQAATRNIAAAYHVLDRLGTLEAGKLADLVILDADPLENVDNYRKIYEVIKDGVEVDRKVLPETPIFTGEAPS